MPGHIEDKLHSSHTHAGRKLPSTIAALAAGLLASVSPLALSVSPAQAQVVTNNSGADGLDGANAFGGIAGANDASNGGNGSDTVLNNTSTINSSARAITAISNGGDGGDGGDGIGVLIVPADGGNGGSGGNGGRVNVVNSGTATTTGSASHGIFAESSGGDGGNGGNAIGVVSVGSIGGFGGRGGVGNSVIVNNVGDIATSGTNAQGIAAQSLGALGGNGGFGAGGIIAVGGVGAGTSPSGIVSVSSSGSISTSASFANGIFAQSVGGFGGNGGLGGGAFGFGADGQSAGNGNSVFVSNNGLIEASGDEQSRGIVAQSVGGGGGTGGRGIGLTAIGGDGFAGGNGGTSSVVNLSNGIIRTQGDFSQGMYAQSIGGGGGDGGRAGAIISIGGNGAGGGSGGTAFARNEGLIETTGDYSSGVQVQSIGGGGGNGGRTIAAGVLFSLGIGGDASGGGNGGAVGVNTNSPLSALQASRVQTGGQFSHGIFAQSVGGGGGNGGAAFGGALSPAITVSVNLGGDGGGGGDGDNVTVDYAGRIETEGQLAHGILAQSIGGGGGYSTYSASGAVFGINGALAMGGSGGGGGDGGTVTVNTFDDGSANPGIFTEGDNSIGIFAQSVGGGGGYGGFTGSGGGLGALGIGVSIGSTGGDGGSGSNVFVDNQLDIETLGDNAQGIYAQSIGGGGGNGGMAFGLELAIFAFSHSVGGDGGSSISNGGDVTASNSGDISTEGDLSYGIFTQSVGGGGGNGALAISGAGSVSPERISAIGVSSAISVGGEGGAGGDGGIVTVDNSGNISTQGDITHALFSQSVGGGGGNAGYAGSISLAEDAALGVAVGRSGGDGGQGNTVDLTNTGSLSTTGTGSNAIFAQSVGGGGGNGGSAMAFSVAQQFSAAVTVSGIGGAGNEGGAVIVDNGGSLSTAGNQANALFAQSVGGGGGNGGLAISGTLSIGGVGDSNNPSGSLSVAVGGQGGLGADGGTVTVTNSNATTPPTNMATIVTDGFDANGILAQSVGGGGGNGGFSGAFTIAGNTSNSSLGASVSIGGSGNDGGSGGQVTVNSVDNILTRRTGSSGIHAQSVGGGGGNGGFSAAGTVTAADDQSASISVSVGGQGGSGSGGGVIDVDSAGFIQTKGDDASGIIGQSVGGGGGSGGLSIAASLTASDPGSGGISVSVGGSGGNGGFGGSVDVAHIAGDIATSGNRSYGIQAQSLGGGGGNGGLSLSGTLGGQGSRNIGTTIGGAGGAGTEAGPVTLDNSGNIATAGLSSHGIFAQSIGGGGGVGGFAGTAILGRGDASGQNSNINLAVSVGGTGGGGGLGNLVEVINDGRIDTTGGNAIGILAQSIGGGGGNGGATFGALAGIGAEKERRTVNANINVGGAGGDGNFASAVVVEQSGGISTTGDGATGILAQSIGGGGGLGGQANSLSVSLGSLDSVTNPADSLPSIADDPDAETENSLTVDFALGGFGGTGNNAGTVEITNTDFVRTEGNAAHAISAQSIGGGGGTGGNALIGTDGTSFDIIPIDPERIFVLADGPEAEQSATITVGGTGGAAGDGNIVDTFNDGMIEVQGEGSSGLFAQSIGGGGGNAGSAMGEFSDTIGIGGGRLNGILGVDFSAGDGGMVTVRNGLNADATIVATGPEASHAIFAQSIGGGGGTGGSGTGKIDIGGNGGSAGNGGAVLIENQSALSTTGIISSAIVAQSIGGGGGVGGVGSLSGLSIGGNGGSSGDGGTVMVDNSGAIATAGSDSNGILAQSVGGGGGIGGGQETNLLAGSIFRVGGADSSSGSGGVVTVDNSASIVTNGEASNAIFAQSVGGGGGTAGGGIGLVVLGGGTSASGDGGNVTVQNQGAGFLQTNGDASAAIFAQSVGGGGGNASNSKGTSAAFSPNAGGGGVGGAVEVVNDMTLNALGENSFGIFAQSVGGGGGSAGVATSNVTSGLAGNTGDGGAVDINNMADIFATGTNSVGIFAQSVGGGGGLVNSTFGQSDSRLFTGSGGGTGNGDTVNVDHNGNIIASGLNAIGILAQSDGQAVANIDIDILGGSILGGSGEGSAISFLGGSSNTLRNAGILSTSAGIDGVVIRGAEGDETIENTSSIIGSVDLGGGSNTFNNRMDAVFSPGDQINLGADTKTLLNEGTVSPGTTGGTDTIQTTVVEGRFVQTTTGTLEVDLNTALNASDRLDVTGTASLEGTMELFVIDPSDLTPGSRQVTFVNAGQGLTQAALTLSAPQSAVAQFEIIYPNANDAVLSYDINYEPAGVPTGSGTVGNFVNSLQQQGGSTTLDPLVNALFQLPSADALAAAYEEFTPEVFSIGLASIAGSAGGFTNFLQSCESRDGLYRFVTQEDCVWANVNGRHLSFDGDPTNAYSEEAYGVSVGMQRRIANDTHLGFAVGYEDVAVQYDAGDARLEGERFSGGIVAKRHIAGTMLTGSLVAGYGVYDSERFVDLGILGGTAEARPENAWLSATLGLSHLFANDFVYARPGVEVQATSVRQFGFQETGAGLANLDVDSQSHLYASISPSVEFGGEFRTQSESLVVRPWLKAGLKHYFEGADPEISATLVGSPDGVVEFGDTAGMDETLTTFEAGLDLITRGGSNLKFNGQYILGENTEEYRGTFKFTVPLN